MEPRACCPGLCHVRVCPRRDLVSDEAMSSEVVVSLKVVLGPVSGTVVCGVDDGMVSVLGTGGSDVVVVSGRKVVGGSGPGPVLTVEEGSVADVVVEDGSTVVDGAVVDGAVVDGAVVDVG